MLYIYQIDEIEKFIYAVTVFRDQMYEKHLAM